MKRTPINKISKAGVEAVMGPPTTGLIAMRLGRANAQHYFDLSMAIMIAKHVTDTVARHAHLRAEIDPALKAMAAIFERHEQRTIPDAPFSGTADEMDAAQDALKVYRAIILTTPGKAMARAIKLVHRDMDKAMTAP